MALKYKEYFVRHHGRYIDVKKTSSISLVMGNNSLITILEYIFILTLYNLVLLTFDFPFFFLQSSKSDCFRRMGSSFSKANQIPPCTADVEFRKKYALPHIKKSHFILLILFSGCKTTNCAILMNINFTNYSVYF